MAGNLCRCGAYPKIERAILRAAGQARLMPRLVKTQREMEGRFEDVWALVDEEDDARDVARRTPTWRSSAARRRARTGAARRGRRGPVHGRRRARPGCCTPPCCARPRARPRRRRSTSTRRARRPACARCSGRRRRSTLRRRAAARRRAALRRRSRSRPSPPTRPRPPRPGSRALAPDVRGAAARRRPDEALREQRFTRGARGDRARRRRRRARRRPTSGSSSRSRRPAQVQTALEPHAAVACVGRRRAHRLGLDAGDVRRAREELARRFGLAPEQVRVIAEFIGGGFGAKQGAGIEALLAAELARVTGRPVRLVNDRHAEQLDGGRRAWTRQTVRARRAPRRDARRRSSRRRRRDGRGRLGAPRSLVPR